MVVLGSREQLCIHEQVSLLHGKAQSNACHLLRKRRDKREEREKHERPHCSHYSRVSGNSLNFLIVFVHVMSRETQARQVQSTFKLNTRVMLIMKHKRENLLLD